MKKAIFLCALYAITAFHLSANAAENIMTEKQRRKIVTEEISLILKQDLKDPFSAVITFKFISNYKVCGEINAKNSFGAYTGNVPFFGWYGTDKKTGRPTSIGAFTMEGKRYDQTDFCK